MSNEEKNQQSRGMTRRGFLGRVSLGLAAAVALTVPVRNLLSSDSSSKNPAEDLPEDSIFRPADDSNGNGPLNT